MEEKNCKYHPTIQSQWYCQHCDVHFCNGCVPQDKDAYLPKCTLCRRSLESLSIATSIPPFWQKIGDLSLMPVTRSAIGVLLLFAAIFSLLPFGKIGAILFLICLIPLVEFMFVGMEEIAAGDSLKISFSEFTNLKNKSFFLKILGVYALAVIFIAKISALSAGISFAIAAFLVVSLPASLIILMMEKSMFNMLSPAKIIYIIKLFGNAYFVFCTIILAVCYLGSVSVALVQNEGDFIARLMVNFGVLYLTLLTFLMAGYLVFQHHRELNFTINRQSIYSINNMDKVDPLAEVNIFIQEGRFEDARKLLLDKIDANPADYLANEKLILLYALEGNNTYLEKIAQAYFNQLIKLKKSKYARDFYLKLQSKSVSFLPESIQVVIAISGEMKNKKDFKQAIQLIESYVEKYKMPTGWEVLFFTHAQLLIEFANQLPQAEKILTIIAKRGIDQEIMQKAENYLKVFS